MRISGKQIIDGTIELAETLGWRAVHFRPARTQKGWRTAMQGSFAAGFPDLVLLRGTRLVVAEVKGDGDKLRTEQANWLLAFGEAGVESALWTKIDWLNGTIERCLRSTTPVIPESVSKSCRAGWTR